MTGLCGYGTIKYMKICVFGAASAHIDKIYIDTVEELGRKMAERGHSLVFGAGGTGLMGAAARGVKSGGGYVHGVVPSFFKNDGVEQLFDACDKMTYTQTMRERKAIMEDEADAFIITPGGVGTFEELFEVVTLKQPQQSYCIFGYRRLLYAVGGVYAHCVRKAFRNRKLFKAVRRGNDGGRRFGLS